MSRKPSESVVITELDGLNSWPDGTVGHKEDEVLIRTVLQLCHTHGFGRVSQLTEQIRQIWREPEWAEDCRKNRTARLALFKKP